MIRKELHYTERAELAVRRDEILSELGLRTTATQGRPRGADSAPLGSLKTTANIAKEMGMSERSLQVNKQIARDLTPQAKEVVKNTKTSKFDALKLSRMNEEEQDATVEQVI